MRKCESKKAAGETIVLHSFHVSFSLTSFSLNNAAFPFFAKKEKRISLLCIATLFSKNNSFSDWLTSYRLHTPYSYSHSACKPCIMPSHSLCCLPERPPSSPKTPPQVVRKPFCCSAAPECLLLFPDLPQILLTQTCSHLKGQRSGQLPSEGPVCSVAAHVM